MGGACSTNGEKMNAYRLLVGKTKRKTPPGVQRCRWVDDIETDLGAKECDGVTGLLWLKIETSGALVKAVMNLPVL
jgi:hypothetical protein